MDVIGPILVAIVLGVGLITCVVSIVAFAKRGAANTRKILAERKARKVMANDTGIPEWQALHDSMRFQGCEVRVLNTLPRGERILVNRPDGSPVIVVDQATYHALLSAHHQQTEASK